MRFSVNLGTAFALAALFAVATTVSASAECKRYGFTVNDYGKDGPTKDAKDLLDKLIQSKMSERGVSDFRTGKKTVNCELFLNFIVFDEHTCTAEATVCWGGSSLPSSEQSAADDAEPAKTKAASTTPAEEKPTKKSVTKEAATHTDAATPATHKTASQPVPDPKSLLAHKAKKTEEKKQVATAPNVTGDAAASDAVVKPIGAASKVETGSLADVPAKPAKHKKAAADAAAAKPDADAGGYPTPLPPQDGAGDAQ